MNRNSLILIVWFLLLLISNTVVFAKGQSEQTVTDTVEDPSKNASAITIDLVPANSGVVYNLQHTEIPAGTTKVTISLMVDNNLILSQTERISPNTANFLYTIDPRETTIYPFLPTVISLHYYDANNAILDDQSTQFIPALAFNYKGGAKHNILEAAPLLLSKASQSQSELQFSDLYNAEQSTLLASIQKQLQNALLSTKKKTILISGISYNQNFSPSTYTRLNSKLELLKSSITTEGITIDTDISLISNNEQASYSGYEQIVIRLISDADIDAIETIKSTHIQNSIDYLLQAHKNQQVMYNKYSKQLKDTERQLKSQEFSYRSANTDIINKLYESITINKDNIEHLQDIHNKIIGWEQDHITFNKFIQEISSTLNDNTDNTSDEYSIQDPILKNFREEFLLNLFSDRKEILSKRYVEENNTKTLEIKQSQKELLSTLEEYTVLMKALIEERKQISQENLTIIEKVILVLSTAHIKISEPNMDISDNFLNENTYNLANVQELDTKLTQKESRINKLSADIIDSIEQLKNLQNKDLSILPTKDNEKITDSYTIDTIVNGLDSILEKALSLGIDPSVYANLYEEYYQVMTNLRKHQSELSTMGIDIALGYTDISLGASYSTTTSLANSSATINLDTQVETAVSDSTVKIRSVPTQRDIIVHDLNTNVADSTSDSLQDPDLTTITPIAPSQDTDTANNTSANNSIQTSTTLYNTERTPQYPQYILGMHTLDKQQIINFIQSSVEPSNASSINVQEVINNYFAEAIKEGVNPEVAIAQMLATTNMLKYKHYFDKANPANISSTNELITHNFENLQTGIRAHIQHLKAYASEAPISSTIVDPRYSVLKTRNLIGTANTVAMLENTWYDNKPTIPALIQQILANMYSAN